MQTTNGILKHARQATSVAKVLSDEFIGPCLDLLIALTRHKNYEVRSYAGYLLMELCTGHLAVFSNKQVSEVARCLEQMASADVHSFARSTAKVNLAKVRKTVISFEKAHQKKAQGHNASPSPVSVGPAR